MANVYEAQILPELEDEMEEEAHLEAEGENFLEGEEEINPVRKVYPDAVMEHLGELAAESETEDEAAEHFLPLVGMAASKLLPVVGRALAPAARRALPKIARSVTRVTPQLTKSVGSLARRLHRNPAMRPLLRAVPAIARRTVHSIARQVARHKPITARSAVGTLARQAARVLGHHRNRHLALRRHHNLDRRFHWRNTGVARPHYGGQYRVGRYVYGSRGVSPAANAILGGVAGGVRPTGSAGRCQCGPSYCRCCGQVLR